MLKKGKSWSTRCLENWTVACLSLSWYTFWIVSVLYTLVHFYGFHQMYISYRQEQRLVSTQAMRLPSIYIIILARRAARLRGFEEDLHLKGSQFSTVLSIFFIGYILMQIPSLVCQQMHMRIFLIMSIGTCFLITLKNHRCIYHGVWLSGALFLFAQVVLFFKIYWSRTY